MNTAEEKRRLRMELKRALSDLKEEDCRSADREIALRILSMEEYQQAHTVFCFAGTRQEIDTVPVLLDALRREKRLALPRCIAKGIMEAYEIHSLEDLEPGSYGILEPKSGCMRISPKEIDLSLIPCLSASPDGRRLGYGGGYYDRYMAGALGVKAALCREDMMQKELPAEEHDQRMDLVVSEERIYRCPAGKCPGPA